jgi:hypothetical protein
MAERKENKRIPVGFRKDVLASSHIQHALANNLCEDST